LLNKDNGEPLFEHTYNNFKHYDFDNAIAVNSADVTSTYKKGNAYETLNFDKIGLGYDNFSPIIEDRKIITHFNTLDTTTISNLEDNFEIFLLDRENKGLINKVVNITITNDNGFKRKINVMTDIFGRVIFNPRFEDGEFNVKLEFVEDETYRGCSYETTLIVDIGAMEYHFEYPRDVTVLSLDYPYLIRLVDGNDNGVSDIMLHYSFRQMNGNYGYERTVTTDNDGYAVIPIDYVNGTVMLKVVLKGFEDSGTTYQPIMFEEEVNINV